MLRLMNSLRMRTPTQLTSTSRRLTSQRCNHFQLARLGCRAASGGPSDRSWADLAGDAANLAKGVVSKAAVGLEESFNKITGNAESKRAAPIERDGTGWGKRNVVRQGESDIFGGLMGMAVKSIFSAVGKQLQQATQQSAAVREQAAALIESDFRVQRALGGGRVQVGRDAISQSSSTTIINGQRSAAVTLLLPVQSSGGQTATAEVSFQQSPTQEDADAELRILVRTANGQVVQINGGRGDKEGAIDVDWREIK